MNIYFDTSSWVKKYIQEPGTGRLLRMLKRCKILATSKIAYAEVYSALSRRRREGTLTRKEFSRMVATFEKDWRAMTIVELSDDVLSLVPSLAVDLPLRGFDAIHLSSALWLHGRLPSFDTFVCSDQALLRSAAKVGLRCIDPEA